MRRPGGMVLLVLVVFLADALITGCPAAWAGRLTGPIGDTGADSVSRSAVEEVVAAAVDSTGSTGSIDSTEAAAPGRAAPALDLANGPVYPPRKDEEFSRFAERSTTAAVLMSVPLPGWGQFYGDTPFWGVVAFSVQMWFYGNIATQLRRQERQRVARDEWPTGSAEWELRDAMVIENSERARDFVWWAAGSLLLVSLDAYVSVQLVDFDSPVPPTPDLENGLGAEVSHGGVMALTLHLPF